jgi:predicted aldo/keto reductase-like oxidoreductase
MLGAIFSDNTRSPEHAREAGYLLGWSELSVKHLTADQIQEGHMDHKNERGEQAHTRRKFLHLLGASTAAGLTLGTMAGCDKNREALPLADPPPPDVKSPADPPSTVTGVVPRRILGKTGVEVSMIGIGGSHIGTQPDENDSIKIIRTAIDNGINFMDNSWDYNDGQSEIRMGKALRDGYRKKVFLMTKIDGRDKKTAQEQLDESLKRLQTDTLDLLQFHEIIRMTDPDAIFAPGGAIETALEARKAGKIRYIGFTGHKSPDIHLKMLKSADTHKFEFDTVQMPLNVMDAQHDSFQQKVLPVLVERKIGVLGMKPIGGGVILQSNTVDAVECLQYALSLPTSVVITGCDSLPVLEQALKIARTFKPLDEKSRAALVAKARAASTEGKFELYKSSHHFDSTVKHPEWLGKT